MTYSDDDDRSFLAEKRRQIAPDRPEAPLGLTPASSRTAGAPGQLGASAPRVAQSRGERPPRVRPPSARLIVDYPMLERQG